MYGFSGRGVVELEELEVAGVDGEAEIDQLAGSRRIALLEPGPSPACLPQSELGAKGSNAGTEGFALGALGRKGGPGEHVCGRGIVVGSLGGRHERTDGGRAVAELGQGAAELEVGPGVLRRALEHRPQLGPRGRQLMGDTQQLGQTQARSRGVRIEIEPATYESTLGDRLQLTVLVEDVVSEVPLVVVEDRAFPKHPEHEMGEGRGLGTALPLLLDEHDIGPFGPRVFRQHEQPATALAHDAVPRAQQASAIGRRGLDLRQRKHASVAAPQIEAVPARPEHRGSGWETGLIEALVRSRRAHGVQPRLRVVKALFATIQGTLDATAFLGIEVRRPRRPTGPAFAPAIAHAAHLMKMRLDTEIPSCSSGRTNSGTVPVALNTVAPSASRSARNSGM
jgi:hypothetical protein